MDAMMTKMSAIVANIQSEHLQQTSLHVRRVSETVAHNASASQEISMMTAGLYKEADSAGKLMAQAVQGMGPLQVTFARVGTTVAEIRQVSEMMESLVSGIAEISMNVNVMAEGSAAQSAALEEVVSAVGDMRLGQGTADEARQMVFDAMVHAGRVGLERAAADFQDPQGNFINRDPYVFVIDRAGYYVVHGAAPEKDGTPLQAIEGLDGDKLVSDAFAVCDEDQGGWVTYAITNPLTGVVQAKISYVKPLDEDRLIGCGCYLNADWLKL